MALFIKLHTEGEEQIINADTIKLIYPAKDSHNKDCCRILFIGNDNTPFRETMDQVEKIITAAIRRNPSHVRLSSITLKDTDI